MGVLIQKPHHQVIGGAGIQAADADGALHALQPYIVWLKDQLHLTHYRFEIELVEGDGTRALWIECLDTQRRSRVYITPIFFQADDEERRHFLVHEMVHRILHDIRTVAGGLERRLGCDLWEFFKDQHDKAVDTATDWITGILCAMLPTPGQWAQGWRGGPSAGDDRRRPDASAV